MLTVQKNDYEDWKALHVTKTLVERFFLKREETKEDWVDGKFKEQDHEFVRGYLVGLKDAINYIISDFEVEEEKND